MKKILLSTSILIGFVSGVSAQRSTSMVRLHPKTTIGIRAGVNFFTITGNNFNGDKVDNNLVTGFTGGLNAELPLGAGFYLQPGVEFTQKGFKNANYKTILNYLDVPVNFIYKPIIGRGNLVLGVGPYVGIGVGGKGSLSNNSNSVAVEQDVLFTDNYKATLSPQYKKTDVGANFLAGYEFGNKVSLGLTVQLGLKNIQPENNNSNDKTDLNNTGFGFTVGYRF